jgi:hypothetical protein
VTYRPKFSVLFHGVAQTEFMEGHAFQLVQAVCALLAPMKSQLPPHSSLSVPSGPLFDYQFGEDLFLGRTGRGPLRITWDTNLLLDFFEHGEHILTGLPIDEPGALGEELEAMQVIMALSMVRDIRFRISGLTVRDSKTKRLSRKQVSDRWNAYLHFAAALTETDGPEEQTAQFSPTHGSDAEAALAKVPQGNDRALVLDALSAGQHVFLTRDRKIRRARESLSHHGLLLVSPQDLLEMLASSGALLCLIDPGRYLQWGLLDPHRVTHLLEGLTYDLSAKHQVPQAVLVQSGDEIPFVDPVIPWVLSRFEEAALEGDHSPQGEHP